MSFDEAQSEPSSWSKQVIRLGCLHCDRDDFDGVLMVPDDWHGIHALQAWEQSVYADSLQDDQSCKESGDTHRGVCPECFLEYTRHDPNLTSESGKRYPDGYLPPVIDPVIRMIVDRDCHVGESPKDVVRHVISRLRYGYQTFRKLSAGDRRIFVQSCVLQHLHNRNEYHAVMQGFLSSREKVPNETLTAQKLVQLMRKHRWTIEGLAFRLGTSQKRVREARLTGLDDPLAVRDWLQALIGKDPGPIPKRIEIHRHTEEGECCFCGFPLYVGDTGFEYVGDLFCSTSCARGSRGWA